jgi:hypothetical protein
LPHDHFGRALQVRHPELKITMFQARIEIVLEKMALEVRGTGRAKADGV